VVVSSADGYRLWAPTYDGAPNPVLALEERMARTFFAEFQGRTVIDVGCGTGRWLRWLLERGALAFGIDASPEMLREAGKKPGLRAKLAVAEASYLPIADASADVTVCSFALSYVVAAHAAIGELARITKTGGRVIISDLHPLAAAKGWNRSFQVGDDRYEIAFERHAVEELSLACAKAGLEIVTRHEAGFAEPERPIFARAGKEVSYLHLLGTPAVLVIVCRKL
jgi:SAM-dependent methyltransferase